MSITKKVMMDRIRNKLGVKGDDRYRQFALKEWLGRRNPAINIVPQDIEQNFNLFIENATKANACVLAESHLEKIPSLINQFISDKKLPNELVIMDPALAFMQNIIETEQDIKVLKNLITKPATTHQVVSLTLGLSAIAESGTVMVASNPSSPSRLYFLPTAHIIMVSCQHLVKRYEEALQYLAPDNMPRAVHFITGPSQTADIDQTIEKGMHGPKELLIIFTP
ncbi:MAG: LutC/YkgG family protein [Alphaproteobacteria bacterium]